MKKIPTRSIVQPFVIGIQVLFLATPGYQRPELFNGAFAALLSVNIAAVLIGSDVGARRYHRVLEARFRVVLLLRLSCSGLCILIKGVREWSWELCQDDMG